MTAPGLLLAGNTLGGCGGQTAPHRAAPATRGLHERLARLARRDRGRARSRHGAGAAAAFSHALFGALQKGRHDPWLSRGAIDLCYGLIAAALRALRRALARAAHVADLRRRLVIHVGYKVAQASAFSFGAYTVVYPVVRGTGPFFTVIGAWLLFGETFAPLQWLGVGVLMAGIFGLAAYNLRYIVVDRA
jgi:multidrug transporter EmrE-like cation transporter